MLMPELSRQGHEVAVAVRSAPYDLEPELQAAGVRVIRLPRHHKWNLIAGARNIAEAMPDADILHAHLYFPAIYTALARQLGITQGATCVTFHNLAYAGANRDGLGLQTRKLLAGILYSRGFQSKLAVSRAVADHYRTALSLDRIDVVYNPTDLTIVNSIKLADSNPTAPLHIVLPGRLVPEKGHRDLISALRNRHLAGRSLRITFVGHGPLHRELLELAEDIPFPLTITGELKHAHFLELVSSADIVVIPSRFEGFGLTALEAMGLSKPVIASCAGGLPEVMGNTGRLVAIGDVDALACAIAALLDDPGLRETMGRAASIRAATEFSLPRIAGQLIKIYKGLLLERTQDDVTRKPETP